MTIETYEAKRMAKAREIEALFSPGSLVPPPPPSPVYVRGSRVRCADHPEWGALTSADAAVRAGAPPSEIRKAARYCRRCRGLRWHLDGAEWAPAKESRAGIRVRCVETGDEFRSMAAAARWVEERTGRRVPLTSVNHATRTGGAVCGMHFRCAAAPN